MRLNQPISTSESAYVRNQFRELINNNTTPLTGVIPVVEKALFRLAPLSNTFRKIAVPVQRKLRPLGFAMGHRGIWVALLAPDGGGKSTLSRKLINQPLLRAKSIYMGINVDASTVGFPTTKKLKQAVKSLEANKEKRKMLAVVKAAASINKLLEHWYRLALGLLYSFNGRTVIFDRFVYDGYINARPKRLKSRLRHLLLWGVCPDADLTVYLDAPGEVLFRRKGEHSPEVLETQRRKYHGLQGKIPNFHVIDATQAPEEVLREVMQLIWLTLQQLSKR